MDTPKNPIKSDFLKSKEKRKNQKSDGLSGAVVRFDKFDNDRRHQKHETGRPLLDVGDTMSRVLAEYEADGGPRVIKPNYVSVTGWIAGTTDHDPVEFESSLERDCAFIAMFEPRITLVKSQPYTIIYIDRHGKRRRYTPDFELSYLENGSIQKAVIEVKPSKVLEGKLDKFQDRFDAMEALAERNGGTFHVLTERQIRTPRLPNTQSLFSRVYDREINGTQLSKFFRELKPFLPCKLGDAIKIRGKEAIAQAEAQSFVWALLAGFELETDLSQKITYETELCLGDSIDERDLFFEPGEPWQR